MPRIALVTDLARAFDPHADPRNVAMIRRRHALWSELARIRGWDVAVLDASAADALERARDAVAWIDLPMRTRDAYRAVFARTTRAGAASVGQHPDEVERVLGLDRFHPVLRSAGVPTPRTALVPVDDALAATIDSPGAVRRSLTERLYEALFDAALDPHQGVYVRGFYSSTKSTNPEHYYGNNQADIEATVFEVIRRLRTSLEVGGLALREHLDLERITISGAPGARDEIRVPFEVRLTVVAGRPILGSYHGPFEVLADEPRRALIDALAARRSVVERALRDVTPLLRAADLPESYVADLAFTREGDPVVLELNPLYAAGYNVPAAHALVVAALGAELGRLAGAEASSFARIRADAAALGGEVVEGHAAVWLLEDERPAPEGP